MISITNPINKQAFHSLRKIALYITVNSHIPVLMTGQIIEYQ